MLLGGAPRFSSFVPHFHRPGRVDYPCPRSSRRPYAHQPSFFGGGQLLVPSAAVQRDPAAQCGARYRASRRKREGLPESLKYVLPPCGLVASGWQAPTCGPPQLVRCSNYASGPFSLTWPTPRPVSRTILTITITTDCTPASAIRCPITLTNTFFKLLP